MNYRSNVAYQQRDPSGRSGRDNYYYRNDEYRNHEMNNGRDDSNYMPELNRQRQPAGRYEDGQPQGNYYQDSKRYGSGQYQTSGPSSNDRYGNSLDPVQEPAHRYPQTFQSNQNPPRSGESSRDRPPNTSDRDFGGSNMSQYPDTNYSHQPTTQLQDRENHYCQDNGVRQDGNQFRNQQYSQQYGSDQHWNYQHNERLPTDVHSDQNRHRSADEQDAVSSNRYDYHRDRPVQGYGANTEDPRSSGNWQGHHQPQNIGAEQRQTDYRPGSSADQPQRGQRQPIARDDYKRSSFERGRPDNSGFQQNHSEGSYHDSYRNVSYNQSSQPPAEPPQIIAKTSGSNAVFGIVAKVDASPTRRQEPREVASPTRTQPPPLTSPTRDFQPSFDQYRDRDSNHGKQQQQQRQQHHNQHQYRQALTPISEKPSPTSSISSRGQTQDSSWQKSSSSDFRNQYGPPDNSRQSWQDQTDKGYHNQSHSGEPDRYGYRNTQKQYPDVPHSQTGRTGYKDYDNSSGYASESTHNTESSYNDSQRYPDKNVYSSNFPPPPPDMQRNGDWPRSPTESYSRSPPTRQLEPVRNDYNSGQDSRGSQFSQRYDQTGYNNNNNNRPPDSYGPPVSIQTQNQYNNRRQPPIENRHGPPEYVRDHPGRDPNEYQRKPPQQGPTRPYESQPRHNVNSESGVEESHVPGVQAARSMFEKRSDPRRPPPAPKPLIAPKPSNINARPVPPRPTNFSSNRGWDERDDRNQFRSQPYQGPQSPTSPHDTRPQPYQQTRQQPSHSQSMDNLDDRTRYQSQPSYRPQHAQSMQNLDERSRGIPDNQYYQQNQHPSANQSHRPSDNYRNNNFPNSSRSDDRPMVLAVKYNQDSGTSLYTSEDPPRRQGSWNRPPPEKDRTVQQPHYRPQPPNSPTMERTDRSSWSADPNANNYGHQSYQNNNSAPVHHPQGQNQGEDSKNYVPDVVARSYELARQSQQPEPGNHFGNSYNQQKPPQERNYAYDSRPQRAQNFDDPPQNKQSTDRWPTPPPPISQDQSQITPRNEQMRNNESHVDDWRRLEPLPMQSSQPPQQNNSADRQTQNYPPGNRSHGYIPSQTHNERFPPPPQQSYQYDSDSTEIDVDAPTPPPSKNLRPGTLFDPPRGSSQYEKNKPIPVSVNSPPDSWRRVSEQPPNSQPSTSRESPYSAHQQQSYNAQQRGDSKSSSVKSPPPQKPQRNSTSQSPKNSQTAKDFDFDDVVVTQQLQNLSSRDKIRISKSGPMANRKPPSRQGSTSNLLDIDNEDSFQIEVTDSDLSSNANKMEVHRMESMRILKAEKEKKTKDKDETKTNQTKSGKQRTSQKVVPPAISEEPTQVKSAAKKTDSKFVFKKPTGDAAKTIPMPEVTEPASQSTRRPPTYLGFGNAPEKPKTDLLTQFKSAKNSAMRTAAEKQDKAFKSVSALVKLTGKKEPKKPPEPKISAAERNAKVLGQMNVEVAPPDEEIDERIRDPYHRHRDERGNVVRSSTRSSSTVKPEKYDGDDDTTNGSRHERERRGRGRDRHRDDDRAKSRGRSTSRGRDLSPEHRRGRSASRGRDGSPERRRGRSTSRGRELSPGRYPAHSRRRSKSRERSLSPDDRYRPRKDYDDRRHNDRRHRDDEYRRSNSPDRPRYRDDDRHYQRMSHHHHPPYDRNRGAREPDWVEQFRRGRESGHSHGHPSRRAWVNDPRRVEVSVDGRRRELDMDAFEREVKKATSYNSDFEQPPPRRQMIPSKLSSKQPPSSKRKTPPDNWMNDLKERNRMATKARHGVYNPTPYRRQQGADPKYNKFGRVPRY